MPTLNRKRLFALHGWLGLNFGLWLAVVCFTGAIASLTHELDWVTDPALRIQPQGPIHWQKTYEALTRAYSGSIIDGFRAGEPTVLHSLAWMADIMYADNRWVQVRVDPYRAAIVRPGQHVFLTGFIRQLHKNLHESVIGPTLVAALAIPLLLSTVSGLLFFKNRWRSLVTLRLGQGRRVFWSSVHPFLGMWSLFFALLIGVTGVWYLVEQFLPKGVVLSSAPMVAAEQLAASGLTPQMLPLEQYVVAAKQAFPTLNPTGIRFPRSPDGAVRVMGRTRGEWFSRDRANAVYLAPFSGKVIRVEKHAESGPLTWWANSADSLHFGFWGGLAGKVVWSVCGLGLSVLILSGAYLSFRRSALLGGSRTRNNRESRLVRHRLPMRSYVTLGVLCVIIGTTTEASQVLRTGPTSVSLGTASLGPWMVSLSREAVVDVGGNTEYYLRVKAGEGRVPNFKQATLRIANAGLTPQQMVAERGALAMWASVSTPEKNRTEVTMVLEIEDWKGTRYTAEFADRWHETSLTRGSAAPAPSRFSDPQPLSQTLIAVLVIFWIFTCTVVTAWICFDRRRDTSEE